MLKVKNEGNKAIIDVREQIKNGEHPRKEIVQFVKQSPCGTIFEIHLPVRAEPLLTVLSSLGMSAVINELAPDHFKILAVKLDSHS
ncbi:amino acid decarboxylase [Evansella sp. AB-P1]|uniref:amino acid decarboxylase n=1 Tax=Evansella sp. AB-P1 TaxID=3037653 RepID=UPI00241F226A|nr:amino acid decarboxylase [Evansella sp. AB-P1]MDG5788806.1 amino acid decarboxylase [Evansella sp. AB-P1]